MNYGICNLSNIPLRAAPSDKSEMTSQLLFGDHFRVLEIANQWLKIVLAYDEYEGWVDKKQCIALSSTQFEKLEKEALILSNEPVDFVEDENRNLLAVVLGTRLPSYSNGSIKIGEKIFTFQGKISNGQVIKKNIVNTAFMYLNTPYLWGGKTPFGVDCSGLTQMVYKINGFKLFRDASQQAAQGEVLSFIEESEPGDLAFFDDHEGNIIHVGIILANNYIIHASGKVRIDRLDQSGIFNADLKKHTHKLRVIKKII
jgi:hypothetical protein